MIKSNDPDILASLPALKRAARRAKAKAKATGTPLYVLKNGKLTDLNSSKAKRKRSVTKAKSKSAKSV